MQLSILTPSLLLFAIIFSSSYCYTQVLAIDNYAIIRAVHTNQDCYQQTTKILAKTNASTVADTLADLSQTYFQDMLLYQTHDNNIHQHASLPRLQQNHFSGDNWCFIIYRTYTIPSLPNCFIPDDSLLFYTRAPTINQSLRKAYSTSVPGYPLWFIIQDDPPACHQ